MKTSIQSLANSTLTAIYFALSTSVLALLPPPPPDGGYPGFNTAEGDDALFSLDTSSGIANTAVGWSSLKNDLNGSFNTAVGTGTLFLNTANRNTGTGAGALFYNTTGRDNTANGAFALFFNGFFPDIPADNNTAMGTEALFSNRVGSSNTAFGAGALYSNNADSITAVGFQALYSNTAGQFNTALGAGALSTNTLGNGNTGVGYRALNNNVGDRNTAIGDEALWINSTGSNNTAVGRGALLDNISGNQNIALGAFAGSEIETGSDNIDIGNEGQAGDSNTIRIGDNQTRAFIAGIRGITTGVGDAIPVIIDSVGQLGTASSSRRYKTDITPIDEASESILALKPVSFHYKVHKDDTRQFGLIAEEVAEVNPDLVICDGEGNPYTVRYDAVNAMLLNEFLKEHRRVEELKSAVAQQGQEFQITVARQDQEIRALVATVKEQAAQIQKVSAQIEVSKEPLLAAESP